MNQNVCCRNKARNAGHQSPALKIQDEDGFERKQDIKKLGFNDQILIVSSTLLGETASDTKSFTLKLTQAFRWPISIIRQSVKPQEPPFGWSDQNSGITAPAMPIGRRVYH